MSLTVTFLHAHPQTEIAKMIRSRLVRCTEAQIVSGFATPDGIDALRATASAGKISCLVLGAATFKAFEALDDLISSGLPPSAARVHLGHSRRPGEKHPFTRLRPMLHSKVYLFKIPDGTSAAFVGSHNLTGFAMRGLNGEAGVLLEGHDSNSIFDEVRAHIAESYRQASQYDATLKEAYARWYAEYLDQLRKETGDMPRDAEYRRTIILFATQAPGPPPAPGQRLYFELDKRIEEIKALDTEVHLHLFPSLPSSPRSALASVGSASTSVVASVEAIDSGAGSAEVKADWSVETVGGPTLTPIIRPFRPALSAGKQQVRALIKSRLTETYNYLFEESTPTWEPVFGDEVLIDEDNQQRWSPVIGFGHNEQVGQAGKMLFKALPEMSPDSGSFILFSRKRRKRR
jgi:hypothetical protein